MTVTPKMKLECATLAQAGRVEFFKQALTLSLAGVAGSAALFTSAKGVSEDTASAFVAILSSALLLATAAWSLMGLSTYANLLAAIGKGEDATPFEKGMVSHARGAFLFLAATAVSITLYAGLRTGASDREYEQRQALWTNMPSAGAIRVRCDAKSVVIDNANESALLCLNDAELKRAIQLIRLQNPQPSPRAMLPSPSRSAVQKRQTNP